MFTTSPHYDLPLARSAIDKNEQFRSDEHWRERVLDDPESRILLAHAGNIAVSVDQGGLFLLSPAEVNESFAVDKTSTSSEHSWSYLGKDTQRHYAVLNSSGQKPIQLPEGYSWQEIRSFGAQLGASESALAVTATALLKWHETYRYCVRCGQPIEITSAGWVQYCRAEGRQQFPRVEPAVIMSVHEGNDRILLGHNPAWPEGRYSTLAGFVEPGESLEHAVRREVYEEAGLRVGRVRYLGSQAWPYPASLMLGFQAEALSTQVRLTDEEISDARWWTRDELSADVAQGRVELPSHSSIARWIIETWYGEKL